MAQNNW